MDHAKRVSEFQRRLADEGLDGGLVADPDSIFYLSGYWGYASFLSCGRPNFLWVPAAGDPAIITPAMEGEMCRSLAVVDAIHMWIDGIDDEWRRPLDAVLGGGSTKRVALSKAQAPAVAREYILRQHTDLELHDLDPILGEMRMVKDEAELKTMRQAGEVAVSMVTAAQEAIAVGVPEYEISLAAMGAGTRTASKIIESLGDDTFSSPMIHNLQIMQSGRDTCMVHRRPTMKRIAQGDPVYLCFCGITVFKGYWLGFDREFFCGSVTDEQSHTYETCIEAQTAALASIRPGMLAEEIHYAADSVYRDAGFGATYRTGRGTGCSILEAPELKAGNKTPLQRGMTLAVDGGITIDGRFGARVGDSIVVTNDGFEYLTPYPKDLKVI